MHDFTAPLVLAQATRTIGIVLGVLLLLAFATAILFNMRKGRAEVGAELELAANRKPYMDDDELETKKLDRTLGAGLVLLAVIGLALPLYWLAEPSRQANAVEAFKEESIARGENIYVNAAQCASCHGPNGVGGVANYTITDPSTGDYVTSVSWRAPALNTVLYRYTPEQVTLILQYGRGFSPMPAWGSLGGGPLTDQQLEDVINYLTSIQIPGDQSKAEVAAELLKTCAADASGNCTVPGGSYKTEGEAIFNLGYTDSFAGGAYACGRCHTKGWSAGMAQVPGGGGFGPNLTNSSPIRQFVTAQQQINFVSAYPKAGTSYGAQGLSSGRMGSFGVNPNAVDPKTATMSPDQVMLTQDQIAAVVAYERSL